MGTLHEHEEGVVGHSKHWIRSALTALGILTGTHSLAMADSINCKDYQLSEFRALCQYASQNATYIHDHVPVDGLNSLVDGWNAGEFHIIPPAVYTLDKPVELKGIILMPRPSSDRPGSASTTIVLQASSGFKYSSDVFYLLSLMENGGAAGVEIHGEQLPGGLSVLPPGSSLVYLPDGLNNRFTGSILTGHSRVDMLLRFDDSNPDYGEDGDTVNIHRNYFRLNGSSAGAQVGTGIKSASTPHLFNNVFLMDSGQNTTAAVKHVSNSQGEPGGIELRNNDLVFLPGKGRGYRYGVEIFDASGSLLQGNAFYSTSPDRRASDIGIFAHRQPGRSNRWLISTGSGFSPDIVAGATSESESGDSINLLESGSVINPSTSTYPRMTPEAFFAETGDLGFVAASAPWLESTNSTVCSAEYQPVSTSDGSLRQYAKSLMPLFQRYEVNCHQCPTIYAQGTELQFQIPIAAVIFVVSVAVAPFHGWGYYSLLRGTSALPWR
ncbi:MAG: hypothetical protein ACR2PT_11475 [Endozoicomonas sp.]